MLIQNTSNMAQAPQPAGSLAIVRLMSLPLKCCRPTRRMPELRRPRKTATGQQASAEQVKSAVENINRH